MKKKQKLTINRKPASEHPGAGETLMILIPRLGKRQRELLKQRKQKR